MEIMLTAVTFKDWREIVKKAAEQAKEGDAQARKFLADYIIGTPPQRHEHSGRDGDDLVFRVVYETDDTDNNPEAPA